MRDSQRERVYQAEFMLRGIYETIAATGNPVVELDGIQLTMPPEARFGSVESVQSYCDRVLALIDDGRPEWASPAPVSVRERRGTAKAHYEWSFSGGGVIAVPVVGSRWAMREIVVLHELSHHLAPGAKHGPGFVTVMNDLLGRVMGPEVALAHKILCTHQEVKA